MDEAILLREASLRDAPFHEVVRQRSLCQRLEYLGVGKYRRSNRMLLLPVLERL
jgi:hypothetical protein